jgi:hypothetical protein
MRVILLPMGVLVVEIATKEIADPQATRPHQGIAGGFAQYHLLSNDQK